MQNSSRLPITFGLIGVCIALFIAVAAAGDSYGVPINVGIVTQPQEVLILGALVPSAVANGEPWRLLSSTFLHAGFVHLAFNTLSLYFLGSLVEGTFGRARFLALYIASGIAGGLAYLYFDGSGYAVGASGAIFGLLGSVFGYSMKRGAFSWQNPVIRQLLILTALNLYLGFSIPNISNTAHIGGLVGGLAFGYFSATTIYSQKKLNASIPTLLILGLELVLLAVWIFAVAPV